MQLPEYWLTRPAVTFDETTRKAFAALWESSLRLGGCPTIAYSLPYPRWQFLCYLGDQLHIALHGSADPGITMFEPRQSNDLEEFGNQKAIYAASDGLWAMFFAIIDRSRMDSITNACIRLEVPIGNMQDPLYVFSISQSALPQKPWRSGTVYLLPSETFITQPPKEFGPAKVHIAQLASFVPVKPLAKLSVTPQDFPFLADIRGHDDARLQEYGAALQSGSPWPDDD